jgi:hypothetical protein
MAPSLGGGVGVKVYLETEKIPSRSIMRVASALKRHAPASIEITKDRAGADFIVHHVVGVQNFAAEPLDERIEKDRKPYAVVQYCLRSTERPDPAFWGPLWRGAEVVWSYYDLGKFCSDAGRSPDFRFLFHPLGVDGSVFRPNGGGKRYVVGTSGWVAETEAVGECAAAANGRGHFHLGPDLGFPGVEYREGISDEMLAGFWGACSYVAGLRRCEGFELPAYEGLACGARPVVFDAPHYRRWLGDHAVYVPEVEPAELTERLREVFATPPTPVSVEEREEFVGRFGWPAIARKFWEAVA